MQRVKDILSHDLDECFVNFGDFTEQLVIQVGAERLNVLASIQTPRNEFSASEQPLNAFHVELYIRECELPESAKKGISRNAIIYVDGRPFRVIDTTTYLHGLRLISLEQHSARGTTMSARSL